MKTKLQKGWKPYIIRNMAILIGVCYLLHPLHQELSKVMHSFSHHISSPDFVLSHDHQNNEAEDNHHLDTHKVVQSDHEHGMINFIGALFDTSDSGEGQPGKTTKTDVKIFKHLVIQYNKLSNPILLSANTEIMNEVNEKVLNGHTFYFYPPPKNS